MPQPAVPHSFQTTHWSVVHRAVGGDDAAAKAALSTLCEAYWYPIYAYLRRSGHQPHDAEDLTQGFFAWLLQRDTLASADPDKGKLRTFLLTCVRRFVGDERDRAMAQKRGGPFLATFDPTWAENLYSAEPVDDLSPDRLFQRRWALTILDHALTLLGEEFAVDGKAEIFSALRPFLGFGPDPDRRYAEVGIALDQPLGTLKNHVFRLRKRWREIIFEQVALTLADATPTDIRGELSELLGSV